MNRRPVRQNNEQPFSNGTRIIVDGRKRPTVSQIQAGKGCCTCHPNVCGSNHERAAFCRAQ